MEIARVGMRCDSSSPPSSFRAVSCHVAGTNASLVPGDRYVGIHGHKHLRGTYEEA
jgi:hypothetical protein